MSLQVVGTLRVRGAVAGGKSHLSSTSLHHGWALSNETRVPVIGAPSSCHVFFQVRATPVGPPSPSPGEVKVKYISA